MNVGFIGLGAAVETAYLPALRQTGANCYGFDLRPDRQPEGIIRCPTLSTLLDSPLETLFITTSSLHHLEVLEQALASPIPRIVVEKPIIATLAQATRLNGLLNDPRVARRVLALDHWMARTGALQLALGQPDPRWQPQGEVRPMRAISGVADIVKIEGFLLEPSGFNEAGEPVALNFATGEPDPRTLHHPDGVILDIGTHVLAMMRETVCHLGGNNEMALQVISARDRLGRDIERGDLRTAEGEAHLEGHLSGIPVAVWLNKYAGPQGGQKGLRLHLRDGRIISHDRRGQQDVLTLTEGEHLQRWARTGTLYEHCLAEQILGEASLFSRAPDEVRHITRRRLDEVTLLLNLQQRLRGPH